MSQPAPKLVAAWYRKLREEGFRDIETLDGRLLGSDEQRQADAEASWMDRTAVERYYTLALRFLHTRRFSTLPRVRRRIWALHASGRSNMEIARELDVTVKTVRVAVTTCRRMAGLPPVASHLGHGKRAE
jgi:DNA-directed RNA polymerase specialized sigma24 family protein